MPTSHLQMGLVCISMRSQRRDVSYGLSRMGYSARLGLSGDALRTLGSAKAFPGFQDFIEGVDGFVLNTQSQLWAIQEKGD